MAGRDARPQDPVLKTSIQAVHASSAPAQAQTGPESTQNRGKGPPNSQHMSVALHHARQIQNRKEMMLLILSHIETLMELPTAPDATVESPAAEDVATFLSALAYFQPSDYDNLIQERNIDGSCGYTLCPRPRRKDSSRGGYRIVWGSKGSGPGGRGKDMRVVRKEVLEMWCSDACAERAMYLKVQLSEKSLPERVARGARSFVLLDDARRAAVEPAGDGDSDAMRMVEEDLQGLTLQGRSIDTPDQLSRELQELTMQDEAPQPTERMLATVVEKDTGYPQAPMLEAGGTDGGTVEGFHPRNDNQFRNWAPERTVDDDGDEDMGDFLHQI